MSNIKCTDHLGNEYASIKEMCQFWKITVAAYYQRYAKHWSMEKILETPLANNGNRIKCKDHLNNEFNTLADMLKHWNITRSMYLKRKKHGWSLEEILTNTKQPRIFDHLGNAFLSIPDMCQFYGITPSIYHRRIKAKYSLEKALTTKPKKPHCIKDHLNNEFLSKKDMCDYWNIDYNLFINRFIIRNWSLEKTLTTPANDPGTNGKQCTDHLKNTFASIEELCDFYHIPRKRYYARCELEWSLQKILTTGNFKPNEIIGIYTIIKELPDSYYLVNTKKYGETICHLNTLLDEYHKTRN